MLWTQTKPAERNYVLYLVDDQMCLNGSKVSASGPRALFDVKHEVLWCTVINIVSFRFHVFLRFMSTHLITAVICTLPISACRRQGHEEDLTLYLSQQSVEPIKYTAIGNNRRLEILFYLLLRQYNAAVCEFWKLMMSS